MTEKSPVVVSEKTKSIIAEFLAYGDRPYKVPEEPQRTRFQGSRFDFNGKPLDESQ